MSRQDHLEAQFLCLHGGQPDQSTRVPGADRARGGGRDDGRAALQQPQRLGHRDAVLTQPGGCLFVGEAELVYQSLYAPGLFDGVQVLPLEGEVALVELHEQVIDNILGKRNPEEFLLYTRDPAEAVRWVDEGLGSAAFCLDTPDLRQVLKLAQAGKTLPQKATYFHPKPPSGMVFDRLERERRL